MEFSKTTLIVFGFMVVLLLAAAFGIGSLYTKVQVLEGGSGPLGTAARGGGNQPSAPQPSGPVGEAGEIVPVNEDDYIRGNPDARLALIEYSDLECPFCQRFHPTLQQAIESNPDNLMWVYRHFPLESLHPKAPTEAEAAECAGFLAGNEGFWAFVDKIYEVTPSNNGLDLTTMPDLAAQVGIDPDAFADCVDSGAMAENVQEDIDSGTRAGVTGTPGSILLDMETGEKQLISGAVSVTMLQDAIDSMLGQQ